MDAVDAPRQQPGQVGLAHRQRQLAQIVAVADQHVEGIELHFVIVLAAECSPLKSETAIDAEQHRLAIDHERSSCDCAARLRDQRKPIGPVMAVAGEQPHALAVALDDQAIAVVLDFVDPVRPVGNLAPPWSGCRARTGIFAYEISRCRRS